MSLLDDLTLSDLKKLKEMFGSADQAQKKDEPHPMLGRRCIVRTYSAGVHAGDVVYINEMECRLENAIRIWKWSGGGLSLSAVNLNGMKGGRVNKTGEIYLTNCIEFIPVTEAFEKSYEQFIED